MRNDSKNCLACDPSEKESDCCWHSINEALGLNTIASFNDPDASYSFDVFSIFQRKSDGALFWGADSGCSCPEEFENVKSCEDLHAITPNSWTEFKTAFEKYGDQKSDPYNEEHTEKIGPRWIDSVKQIETLDRVRALMYASLK